jgi:hypothetical protein
MKSLDRKGRSLEEVVATLLDVNSDKDLREIQDETFVAKALIQKLKYEMRRYLSKPDAYSMQIEYIKSKIAEIEEKYPDAKVQVTRMIF